MAYSERRSSESFYLDEEEGLKDGLLENQRESSRTAAAGSSIAARLKMPWGLHAILIAIYTAVFLFSMRGISSRNYHGPNLIYSPARDAIHFETVTFAGALKIDSPFTGEPREELDDAWHNLLQNANIRVSKDTLDRTGHTSIPFGDGDGYYAQLGMFHELHCLKMIKRYTHSEYYFPNQTAEEHEYLSLHIDHCIDILRVGTMCRGDASLVTFYWDDDVLLPRPDFSAKHECVNFDVLNSWAGEHAVNTYQPGILKHPKLGDVYHNKTVPHGH